MEEEQSPHCQWILQERLQLLEKMGSKRLRKEKGGRAAAKVASTALEGVQNISARYGGLA